MNCIKFTIALSAGLAATGCSQASESTSPSPKTSSEMLAHGALALTDGSDAGTVKIVSKDGTTSIVVAAANLPEGPHGFHLHQTGVCDGPDFKSAGGHLNPLGKAHGSESPDGAHVGDLPNLEITAEASEPQTFAIEGSEDQIAQWLFDEDGTAVVIHAGPDDYKTDPSGAAGARIACAILARD